MKKKLGAWLLAAVMILTLLPTAARAAEEVGYIERSWDDEAAAVRETQKTVSAYTEVTQNSTSWGAKDGQEHWYVVQGEVTIGRRVTATGDVHLILADGCALTTRGITVEAGNSLTIYGQAEGTGKLAADGGGNPGIGGEWNRRNAGAVTVHGGTVTAESDWDAGIGGLGLHGSNDDGGAGGTVTVYGGTVEARSNGEGAGIGGGDGYDVSGDGGSVTVYGGTVTAASKNGTGIGGGRGHNGTGGAGGTVEIRGGTVTATSENGTGIGGGTGTTGGAGATVTVYGGTVEARSNGDGAGIGGGYGTRTGGAGGTVVIDGGMVTANGNWGAGIGSGYGSTGGDGGTVVVDGGTVTATSISSAGIGGCSSGSDVTIHGGMVTATSEYGAGIGGGNGDESGDTGTLELNGNGWVMASSVAPIDDALITTKGVLFAEKYGIVYGDVALDTDREVPEGMELLIGDRASLTVGTDVTLTNGGEIYNNYGQLINNGTLTNTGMLDNRGTLTNEGTLANGGKFDNDDQLINNGILNNTDMLSNYGTLTNNGTLANGDKFYNNGQLINNHVFNNEGNFTNSKEFSNSGTLTSKTELDNDGTLTNSGTIESQGVLVNYGKLSNTGTVNCYDFLHGNPLTDTPPNLVITKDTSDTALRIFFGRGSIDEGDGERTVTLTKDVEQLGQLQCRGCTLTLDLAGHKITGMGANAGGSASTALLLKDGAQVTVMDSSADSTGAGGTGEIRNEHGMAAGVNGDGAALTVESGSFYGGAQGKPLPGVQTVAGSLTIHGGNFYGGQTNEPPAQPGPGIRMDGRENATARLDAKRATCIGGLEAQLEMFSVAEGQLYREGEGEWANLSTRFVDDNGVTIPPYGEQDGSFPGPVQFAPAAIFTTQPQAVTAAEGRDAEFKAEAAVTGGAPAVYQWQVSDDGVAWQDIEGGTAATLTIPAVTEEMGGKAYRCKVVNHGVAVYSDAAVLTVGPPVICTVTFDANGGSVSPTSAATGAAGKLASLPTPTRPGGYRFDGWFTAAQGGEAVTLATVFTQDGTIHAHWTDTGTTGGDSDDDDDTPTRQEQEAKQEKEAIREIQSAKPGSQVAVELPKDGKLPKAILEEAAGKDVELTIEAADGATWIINGKDLPGDTSFTDLNLSINTKADTIPVDIVNAVTGETKTMQLELSHSGAFGFELTLRLDVGSENADLWANLYHFNENAAKLEFVAAVKIRADGSADLPFAHASSYAVVIDKESHAPAPFTDVAQGAWYYDAVCYVYQNGLFAGTSETQFSPGAPMTRAMLWTVLARADGQEATAREGGRWYDAGMAWAKARGISDGASPEASVTREQLAAMLWRYAGSPRATGTLEGFPDGAAAADYATDALRWAVEQGIITGTAGGSLDPKGEASRAQVAAMLTRYLEKQ